ncbi:MAG: rubredoxin [Candidatus Omnitrophota bacterium]
MERNVLYWITYGIYLVAVNKQDTLNAQVVNTVVQITSKPVILAVSIAKENFTHEFIEESQRFSISILSENAPLRFIGKFGFKSGRQENKFSEVKYKLLASGCPVVLDYALCFLEVKVVNKVDCGTHTVFLAEMTGAEFLTDGRPMTYDYYHNVKNGRTPRTAPTFMEKDDLKKEEITSQLGKYRCTVCNYIYNPALGDPDGGITPGTAFEQIPDDWGCPICGAGKDKFVKI